MMKEMGHLPPRLLEMPSFRTVSGWYGTSLYELHSFQTLQPTEETVKKFVIAFLVFTTSNSKIFLLRFTDVLQNIRKRHSTVIETLAQVNCI